MRGIAQPKMESKVKEDSNGRGGGGRLSFGKQSL